jgi:hypothetical protein
MYLFVCCFWVLIFRRACGASLGLAYFFDDGPLAADVPIAEAPAPWHFPCGFFE